MIDNLRLKSYQDYIFSRVAQIQANAPNTLEDLRVSKGHEFSHHPFASHNSSVFLVGLLNANY